MSLYGYPRRREPELMDRPDLDDARHIHALKGLARVNLWSLAAVPLYAAMVRLARDLQRDDLRVLDLASGGGDVPIRLWRRARHDGHRFHFSGCDLSPRAVEFARQNARAEKAYVDFFVLDALRLPIPQGYDVLTCSLFFHHLSEEEAVALLRKMSQATRHLVAIEDLRRHRAGTALALFGTQFLTRSSVVHGDGLRSVRAAFTMDEASQLAHTAGLDGFAVRPHWPFRFLLTWRRDSVDPPI